MPSYPSNNNVIKHRSLHSIPTFSIITIILPMLLKYVLRRCFTHSKNLPLHPLIDYKVDHYRSVHLTPTSRIVEQEFKEYVDKIMKK